MTRTTKTWSAMTCLLWVQLAYSHKRTHSSVSLHIYIFSSLSCNVDLSIAHSVAHLIFYHLRLRGFGKDFDGDPYCWSQNCLFVLPLLFIKMMDTWIQNSSSGLSTAVCFLPQYNHPTLGIIPTWTCLSHKLLNGQHRVWMKSCIYRRLGVHQHLSCTHWVTVYAWL